MISVYLLLDLRSRIIFIMQPYNCHPHSSDNGCRASQEPPLGEHPPSSMLAENRASCSYTPRQNRATVGLRLAGLLSARVSAHTVTHNGEHPFLLSRVYNPERVLVIAPSACLAYCRIFYLHRFYK